MFSIFVPDDQLYKRPIRVLGCRGGLRNSICHYWSRYWSRNITRATCIHVFFIELSGNQFCKNRLFRFHRVAALLISQAFMVFEK
jgi:hypothetical protein